MLEWLKEILQDTYTEDIEKKVSEEIGKGFVARGDFNVLNETKKTLEKQLGEANVAINDMKSLDVEGIKQAAKDWEEKYNTDTAALKADIENTKYNHIIETLALKESFSSEAAKKAFASDLISKKLPYEEGKIIGYEDFKKTYMENDPGAFAPTKEIAPTTISTGGEHKETGALNADAFTQAAMKGAQLTGKEG